MILPDVITSRMCEAGQLSSISTPPKICCFRVSDGWTALKKGFGGKEGGRKEHSDIQIFHSGSQFPGGTYLSDAADFFLGESA